MEDVGGVAGIDDAGVVAGVNDVGRVLGGGHGALLRRRPWGAVKGFGDRGGGVISAPRSRRAEEAGIRK